MVPLDSIEVGVNCHLPVCGHALISTTLQTLWHHSPTPLHWVMEKRQEEWQVQKAQSPNTQIILDTWFFLKFLGVRCSVPHLDLCPKFSGLQVENPEVRRQKNLVPVPFLLLHMSSPPIMGGVAICSTCLPKFSMPEWPNDRLRPFPWTCTQLKNQSWAVSSVAAILSCDLSDKGEHSYTRRLTGQWSEALLGLGGSFCSWNHSAKSEGTVKAPYAIQLQQQPILPPPINSRAHSLGDTCLSLGVKHTQE